MVESIADDAGLIWTNPVTVEVQGGGRELEVRHGFVQVKFCRQPMRCSYFTEVSHSGERSEQTSPFIIM